GFTTSPVSPSCTASANPPDWPAITGSPQALASASATPKPSTREPSARRDTPTYAFDIEDSQQLGLGHVADEADVVGDVQLSSESLILFALLAAADPQIVE